MEIQRFTQNLLSAPINGHKRSVREVNWFISKKTQALLCVTNVNCYEYIAINVSFAKLRCDVSIIPLNCPFSFGFISLIQILYGKPERDVETLNNTNITLFRHLNMFNSSLIAQKLLLKVKTDRSASIFDEKVSLYQTILQ